MIKHTKELDDVLRTLVKSSEARALFVLHLDNDGLISVAAAGPGIAPGTLTALGNAAAGALTDFAKSSQGGCQCGKCLAAKALRGDTIAQA